MRYLTLTAAACVGLVMALTGAAPAGAGELKQVLVDDFDGDNLGDHWEVLHPDPDLFIVENGGLLILAPGSSPTLGGGEVANIFRLTTPLPKGDWVMKATYNVEFQTTSEAPFLGLYADDKNFLVVQPRAFVCGNWSNRLCVTIEVVKLASGKPTTFSKALIHEMGFENFVFDQAAKTIAQPLTLRIVKVGRKYTGGILWRSVDPETKKMTETWVDLPKLTILRQNGQPAVGMYQVRTSQGESVAILDKLTIEAVE